MKNLYFPIKFKLTLWYVLLLLIVILIFSTTIYFSLQKMIINNEDILLNTQIKQTISSLDIENGVIKLSEEPFYYNSSIYGALLSYPDMKILESNLPKDIISKYSPDLKTIGQYKTIYASKEKWRVYSSSIYSNNKILGILIFAQPLNFLDIAMKNLSVIIYIMIPLIIIVAVVGGILISNYVLKPIDRMTKVAREISMGDLSKRLNLPYTNDEIGRLAQTFDIMIDKLDDSFKRQRQFTHDASHELRTPIAVIQSQAELSLGSSNTVSEYTKALSVILEEAKYMGKLISNMLFLARGDNKADNLQMENLNLSDLIEGIVSELKPIAENNNIKINIVKNEPSCIKGDQTRITQLLYNIIENAIKYTAPEGNIKLYIENHDKYIKIAVQDNGIGISKEHLPHIFERFYRVDKARSVKNGGSGLGLSICQWIALIHGGKIEVFSEENKGSTFIIWLPSCGVTHK